LPASDCFPGASQGLENTVIILSQTLRIWLALSTMLDGFPDGYRSELDRAEDQLVVVFNWISLAMTVWCLCLGVVAGRRAIRKPFLYACALYAAVIFVSLLVDLFFRATLMDSRGG
jgi:hypothetical protein